MDIRVEDVCVVQGFRLTEYQVFNGKKFVNTFFNIRDDKGYVFGPKYDDISKPLNIMLGMQAADINYMLSKEVGYITNRCINAY